MGDVALAEELRRRGIRDERVLGAIASLRRADFISAELSQAATTDAPLPIGHGQTISQPFVVGFMTQALGLLGGEKVLEIGTGSGYQAAVLALLAREVYSIELVPELARLAERHLGRLPNVHLRVGDGSAGWPEEAPFDAILAAAAPARIPDALIEQLAPGGRLVVPVGPTAERQELILMRKSRHGDLHVFRLMPVRFVPMLRAPAAHYPKA